MRVMMMHKADSAMEAGALPSRELITGMGALIGEMAKADVFLAGEGLGPTASGVRLTLSRGKRSVTCGPFAGVNELTAAITIVRVKSVDEAIDWAWRLAGNVDAAELDVRPLKEPWDLGVAPRPEGLATTRFMIVRKADASSEAEVPPASAALKGVLDEMVAAGVLLRTERLLPSSTGTRVRYSAGARTITDGPFAESKELVAGFMLLRVNTLAEALDWTRPFARLIGDVEIDLRPVLEASDLT